MFSWLRKKAATQYQVAIDPANISITIDSGENLLEAAQKRGLFAPYNCRVGACKTCQIVVKEGQPKSLIEREYVFSEQEIGAGAYLACQLKVESDMRIEWPGLTDASVKPTPAHLATLHSIQQMTPRIFRVTLQLETALQWEPGQFAKLVAAGVSTTPRCYSLVNRGTDTAQMVFDITSYPNGLLSAWLTDTRNLGKQIQVEAPFGQFGAVRSDASPLEPPPLLCIAGGSGMGAISGILTERYQSHDQKNPVVLVYGARDSSEIYGLSELAELSDRAEFPLYSCPVLDKEPQESTWEGRRGYIAHHLEKILDEAKKRDAAFQQPIDMWRILLCGPSIMVETSLEVLRACGAKSEHISFDKYEQQAG
jgi:NAD(P)H-flavin reductase/ferredoxin